MRVKYDTDTQLLFQIGDPLDHACACYIHNRMYELANLNAVNLNVVVKKGELPEFIASCKQLGVKGFDITMPHKTDVIPLCDEVEEFSREFACVNHVKIRDGKLIGVGLDGMGMAMFNAWSRENNVPTFGYDANSDAVAAIADGYGGTISQHADVQAYLTLRVLRNALDGVDVDTGIGTADDAGNVLSSDVFYYDEATRSYYALNVAVTADNYQDFLDSTVTYAPVSNQLDASAHPTKNVWLNIYNSADNFLGSTYQPLLQKYDDLLNLNVEYIAGDGQTESNITNRLSNPSAYDAFAFNMVKTDNAASYTALLAQ